MASQYVDLPLQGGSGVTSLNGETGDINLVAGTGITITPAGQNITIAATSSGSVTGTGTANFFPIWTSTTAIGNSFWKQGASGQYQFQNFATFKGTAPDPIISLDNASGTPAGFFTDASENLWVAAFGRPAFMIEPGGWNLFDGGTGTGVRLRSTITAYKNRNVGSGGLAGGPSTWEWAGDTTNSQGTSAIQISNAAGTKLALISADVSTNNVTFSGKSGDAFVIDNTNPANVEFLNKVGIGILAPANKLHIDAGTATASNLQFTAGSTTGQTAADGITFGIKTDARGLIQQNENKDIIVRNNGLDTARFTQYNGLSFTDNGTTSPFDPAAQIVVARSTLVTASSGFAAGLAVVPSVTADADNAYVFYGMAMEPSLDGANGFSEAYGALFAVVNNSSGTSGTLEGLKLLVENSGGGTVTDSFAGLISTADNSAIVPFIYGVYGSTSNSGTSNGPIYGGIFQATTSGPATDLVGLYASEPSDTSAGGISGLVAAVHVDGTLAITQTDIATSGTINALAIATSHIHLTGNPTINGIDSTNHTAQLVILTFSAGGTINNQNASANAADRIITGSGAAIIVVTDGAVTLIRDSTNSRWRVISSVL